MQGTAGTETEEKEMKDYPDRMTAEQARVFGEDVLNIVSQIPRGKVTTYGHIAALSQGGEYLRAYGSWVVSTAGAFGRRGRDVQGQRACGYGEIPLGTGGLREK